MSEAMKISELIDILRSVKSYHGDIQVRATWEGITTKIRSYEIENGILLLDVDQD